MLYNQTRRQSIKKKRNKSVNLTKITYLILHLIEIKQKKTNPKFDTSPLEKYL